MNANALYEALRSRDPRFDGVFFVGVRSTGIYCRPVCTARLPKPEHCTYHDTAAAAEAAGFRPCLRCRPELSPGRSRVDAKNRLAAAAYDRIADGALNAGTVEDLARDLYTSERQLRRAVKSEFGVSPSALAQTHRLLLAKQLLTETDLGVTRIAFASGFSSVSRFNTLFRRRYRMNPSHLRRNARQRTGAGAVGSTGGPSGLRSSAASGDDSTGGELTIRLTYRPPFAWEQLLSFLGARAIPGVERVEAGEYVRTVRTGESSGWIAAGNDPAHRAVAVRISASLAGSIIPIRAGVRRLFDLDAEPERIHDRLGHDPLLAASLTRHPGLRLPGAVDPFEVAIRAVLGQQVTVTGASTIAGRLAERFSDPLDTHADDTPGGLHRLPFTPERLAEAGETEIAEVGLPASRARTVMALARAVAEGQLPLGPAADPLAIIAALQTIPGIGPWTAHYIAMRALHWPDAFPSTDLGIRKALQARAAAGSSNGKRSSAPPTIATDPAAMAESWRPWRAYAAMHLWQNLADLEKGNQ